MGYADVIRIERTITHSLGWPWPSNCRDYASTMGLESQAHCLQECISHAMHGRPSDFLTRDERQPIVSQRTEVPSCLAHCAQPNCYDEQFALAAHDVSAGDGALIVAVEEPATALHIVPALTLDVYMYTVATLINTCLGVAVLDVVGGLAALARTASLRWRRPLARCITLAKCLAVVGALMHTAYASEPYFERATSSELYIGALREFKELAAHLCFDASSIHINGTTSNVSSALTMREIDASTLDLHDIVHSVTEGTNNGKRCFHNGAELRDMSASGAIVTYFREGRKCFRVPSAFASCPNASGITSDDDRHLSFQFVEQHVYYLFLTAPHEFPWTGRMRNFRETSSADYNYIKRSILPSPFASKCVPGFSREICVARCVERQTGKPVIAFAQHFDRPLQDLVSRNESDALALQCAAKCTPPDCVKETFPIKVYAQKNSSKLSICRRFVDTTFELSPLVPLVEYLLIISSVLALWLGFAVPLALRITEVGCLDADATFAFDSHFYAYREHVRNAITATIVTAIAGAFLTHMHSVCELYLQRGVITETTVSRDGTFNPPDFSICMDVQYLWRDDHAQPHGGNMSAAKLHAQTFAAAEIMPTVKLTGVYHNMSAFAVQHVTTYVRRREKCFRISLARPEGFDTMAELYSTHDVLDVDPCRALQESRNRTLRARVALHVARGLMYKQVITYRLICWSKAGTSQPWRCAPRSCRLPSPQAASTTRGRATLRAARASTRA